MNRIFVIVGILLLALVGVVLFSTTYGPKTNSGAVGLVTVSDEIPVYGYKILKTYPHDPKAFTQGLVYYKDDILYEGTGMWGESSLRKVDLKTGQVLQIHTLPSDIFGEGITLWGEKIIQLTWQHRKGFVYDRETFTLLREFSYPTEGWGITHDGTRLIMSDGSGDALCLGPRDSSGDRAHRSARRQGPGGAAQRTRIYSRADLRQRLADRSHRDHSTRRRARRGLD
jgi:glutamine cyclotransferase